MVLTISDMAKEGRKIKFTEEARAREEKILESVVQRGYESLSEARADLVSQDFLEKQATNYIEMAERLKYII